MIRVLVALLAFTCCSPAFSQRIASWDTFDLPGGKGPASDRFRGREVEFLGRKAVQVEHGLAVLPGSEIRDGTIEADIAPSEQGFLLGLAFRVQDARSFELAFFRAPYSGTPEALQYTPFYHGANGWQLRPEAQATAAIPAGRWTHVKLVLAGATAKLFVGEAAEPTLTIDNLGYGDSRGRVGLFGAFGGGYMSNLKVTAGPDTQKPATWPKPPRGALVQWGLSPAFDVKDRKPGSYRLGAPWMWEKIKAEPSGFVIINRYRDSPEIMPTPTRDTMEGDYPSARVAFARTTITAPTAGIRRLKIGFSDEVTVYLNGRPLYAGKNAWRFREPDAHGTPSLNDVVYLPLRKGRNELVLAVSEYMGGWGFQAALEP
jgi:hypothetical protein